MTSTTCEAGCETSLSTGPLDADEAVRLAAMFKAVADPARLRLLSIIAAQEEACVCDLTGPVDLAQPTVSHHLKVLVDAGLVTRDKRGKWAYYAVVPGALDALGAALRTR
ncbi:ArsR/SmtB family transcription factor [Georgenia faecalis]|uniref:ArsR/SmtB family transcription factor n=1 Tax=Georgenia faecalis TaxID=2483799 RepID=UPI000FD7035D|nr:metalloregulator ArsR/SmtB family transcription factor [Georgenia faecalis]